MGHRWQLCGVPSLVLFSMVLCMYCTSDTGRWLPISYRQAILAISSVLVFKLIILVLCLSEISCGGDCSWDGRILLHYLNIRIPIGRHCCVFVVVPSTGHYQSATAPEDSRTL